jgi:hypothetical protein
MNDERQFLFSTLTKDTLRVFFVDRKNYRLQDIQLSKISRGSVAPPGPLNSLTRGAPSPHSVREERAR